MSTVPGSAATSEVAAAVEARGVRVVLGDQTVLRGIDLSVAPGSRVALVGPNGAGKSTLLRVIAGLLRPESGDVIIEGRSIRSNPWHARRAVGMVGHQAMLHPDLTARENLVTYANLYGLANPASRAEAALRDVGLAARAATRVRDFSRGMTQRLALARALLHEPRILLLDEAESGLDLRAHDVLVAALSQPSRTSIVASHDLAFVRQVADEIVFLHRGRVVGQMTVAGHGVAEIQDRYADLLARRPAGRAPIPMLSGG